ncbi:3,4-dioxygenase subunit beta [Auraticoccus sp. F435]|uniref:3,4-dioxygenase subunit beta n=1 Tax=Auraticoccus cholistanensis TaxID=2656650 RepID=A0A6A9USE7_9ACTN|nr:3,4-dioxygenase subunit beta [Auraticoccus cholistanensis]MVA74645.1 3,4-dioxygenase subunit beta [Auraticoccus cholistanensis]
MRHDDTTTEPVPSYQGRPLPRPGEEVVDQGLAFDVGTLLGRRRLLGVLGAGLGAGGLAACGVSSSAASEPSASAGASAGTSAGEIPDETAGPYPGDGSNGPDVLEQSGIVRSDLTTSFGDASGTAEGVPMTLELTITDLAGGGGGFEGAAVYVWHCTREGGYSMYSEGVEEENFLRGVQVADADGLVRFTSVVPACYDGRWPHIHFEVYPDQASIVDSANAVATSQVALPQELCEAVYAEPGYEASVTNLARVDLASDNVFGDDGGASQLATVSGDVDSGFRVRLTAPVDTTTEPTGGGTGGAPGSGGMPGRGEPPSGAPGDQPS